MLVLFIQHQQIYDLCKLQAGCGILDAVAIAGYESRYGDGVFRCPFYDQIKTGSCACLEMCLFVPGSMDISLLLNVHSYFVSSSSASLFHTPPLISHLSCIEDLLEAVVFERIRSAQVTNGCRRPSCLKDGLAVSSELKRHCRLHLSPILLLYSLR